MLETIKTVGPILGYLTTAIALITLVFNGIREKSRKIIIRESGKEQLDSRDKEMNEKLDALTRTVQQLAEANAAFQERMNLHIESQNNTNKKLLASIIEQTYYANREKKTLDINEFRRVTETYAIYHGDEIRGNSYISALYEEMMGWERV